MSGFCAEEAEVEGLMVDFDLARSFFIVADVMKAQRERKVMG